MDPAPLHGPPGSELRTHHARAPLHPDDGQGRVACPGAAEDGIGAQIHEQGLGFRGHSGPDCDGRKEETGLSWAGSSGDPPCCCLPSPILVGGGGTTGATSLHSGSFPSVPCQSSTGLGPGLGSKEETPLPQPSLPRAHHGGRQHQPRKAALVPFLPGLAPRGSPIPFPLSWSQEAPLTPVWGQRVLPPAQNLSVSAFKSTGHLLQASAL